MDDKNTAAIGISAQASEQHLSSERVTLQSFFAAENCPENIIENLVDETLSRLKETGNDGESSNETARKVLQGYYFSCFLKTLAPDENTASEKYIVLQLKIVKKLTWSGCYAHEAETLADKVIEVVTKKINEIEQKLAKGITEENGKPIKEIENINSYCLTVADFIWKEHYRKYVSKTDEPPDENIPLPTPPPSPDDDERLIHLRKCILEFRNPQDRELIVEYYDADSNEKNSEKREKIREKYGLSKSNLKKKVCLLRQKLENCMKKCLEKIS